MSDRLLTSDQRLDVTSDSYRLGELLAIIHGDGGQYQTQHGTGQSVTDAMQKVYDLRAGLDSRSTEIVELINLIDRMKGECVAARCDEKTIAFADRLLAIAREHDYG